MKESTRVLLALGAGLAGGAIIAASGSASLTHAADLIAPIGTVWVNAIRMTVIPLVIALLVTGVASAADLRTIGRIGRRALFAFGGLLIFVAAVIMPIAPFVFRLLPTTSSKKTSNVRPPSRPIALTSLADATPVMMSETTSGMTVMRIAFTHSVPIGAMLSATRRSGAPPYAPIAMPPATAAPREMRTRVLSFIRAFSVIRYPLSVQTTSHIIKSPPLMSNDAPVM